MRQTLIDIHGELSHARQMAARTLNALEQRQRELAEVDVPIPGERELIDALDRQHQLWVQLGNEYETYIASTQTDDDQEELF